MESDGPIKIVSVGQFRPEKDHALQIRAMFELRQIVDDAVWKRVRWELNSGYFFIGSPFFIFSDWVTFC